MAALLPIIHFTVRVITYLLLLQDAGGYQWNAACDATSCPLFVISTTSECVSYKY